MVGCEHEDAGALLEAERSTRLVHGLEAHVTSGHAVPSGHARAVSSDDAGSDGYS